MQYAILQYERMGVAWGRGLHPMAPPEIRTPFQKILTPFQKILTPFWKMLTPFRKILTPFWKILTPFWETLTPFPETALLLLSTRLSTDRHNLSMKEDGTCFSIRLDIFFLLDIINSGMLR